MYQNTGMAQHSLTTDSVWYDIACRFSEGKKDCTHFVKSLKKVISFTASFVEWFFGNGNEGIDITSDHFIERR